MNDVHCRSDRTFLRNQPAIDATSGARWRRLLVAVETLFNDFLRQTFEMLMPPGYTSIGSMKNFLSSRRALGGGRMTAEALIESSTALIETVLAGIERMRERTGFGIFVALLQSGILSDELTRQNMGIFASEDASSAGLMLVLPCCTAILAEFIVSTAGSNLHLA